MVAWLEWALGFAPLKLMLSLRKTTERPILVVSQVPVVGEVRGTQEEEDEGTAFIRTAIAPNFYVPHPIALYSEDGRPNPAYYAGSLDVFGNEPDRTAKPHHHLSHLSREGGALVLAQIVTSLREALSEDGPKAASNSSSHTRSARDLPDVATGEGTRGAAATAAGVRL